VFGLYMLLAKPPGARRYLPVFLGKAGPAEGESGGETIRERWGTALAWCECTSVSWCECTSVSSEPERGGRAG
jgi:hypothetical protein